MITGYRGTSPAEDGHYLVRVYNPSQTWDTTSQTWIHNPDTGELVIAEALVGDGDVTWWLPGADYDYWTHESVARFELDVICKLDLEAIAAGARAQV